MSGKITVEDLENSFPSWISDHLRDCSFMETEVRDYPVSPSEDLAKLVEDLPLVEDAIPPSKKETNITT
ncbi:hypothetical protein Acr_11g0011450 [Actinidia rufa]|uniref:Uncharacterized protein n=1 Tax=Actinidia rufa TaxID=165716 RepID=A0A7J0FF74_9ERIC|nr:hypothetical protein Acr_11g0011450 [Actinidia rufa]